MKPHPESQTTARLTSQTWRQPEVNLIVTLRDSVRGSILWCVSAWLWAIALFAFFFLPCMFEVIHSPAETWFEAWCHWLQMRRPGRGYRTWVIAGAGVGIVLAAVGRWRAEVEPQRGQTGLLWAAVVVFGLLGGGVGVEPLAFDANHNLTGVFGPPSQRSLNRHAPAPAEIDDRTDRHAANAAHVATARTDWSPAQGLRIDQ